MCSLIVMCSLFGLHNHNLESSLCNSLFCYNANFCTFLKINVYFFFLYQPLYIYLKFDKKNQLASINPKIYLKIHCIDTGNKNFHEKVLKLSHLLSRIINKKPAKNLILATIFAHKANFKMQIYFNFEVPRDLVILRVLSKY